MNLEQFVKSLQESLGTKLQSVLLYGSAAAGDFLPGVSGKDILIVAQPLGQTELSALAPHLRQCVHS
jgi:hypothetical protein